MKIGLLVIPARLHGCELASNFQLLIKRGLFLIRRIKLMP